MPSTGFGRPLRSSQRDQNLFQREQVYPSRECQPGVRGGKIARGERVDGCQQRLIAGSELLAEHAFGQERIGAREQPVNFTSESVKFGRRL